MSNKNKISVQVYAIPFAVECEINFLERYLSGYVLSYDNECHYTFV